MPRLTIETIINYMYNLNITQYKKNLNLLKVTCKSMRTRPTSDAYLGPYQISIIDRSNHRRCSVKKLFLQISQIYIYSFQLFSICFLSKSLFSIVSFLVSALLGIAKLKSNYKNAQNY